MLQFNLRWGWNMNLTLCALKGDTEFCTQFFNTLLPKDIWPLLQNSYEGFENNEAFERLWTLLKSSKLKDFTFPKPDAISVKITHL